MTAPCRRFRQALIRLDEGSRLREARVEHLLGPESIVIGIK